MRWVWGGELCCGEDQEKAWDLDVCGGEVGVSPWWLSVTLLFCKWDKFVAKKKKNLWGSAAHVLLSVHMAAPVANCTHGGHLSAMCVLAKCPVGSSGEHCVGWNAIA